MLHYLLIVISHCRNALNHPLYVLQTALLLEVFDLLPQLWRDLGGGSDCVESLREAVVLQELAQILLVLGLFLVFLVQDLLKLSFEFVLHGSDLGWDDVSELVLNRHLGLDVVECWLKLDKVLQVRLGDLVNGRLTLEVDRLVVLNGLVSQGRDLSVLFVEVILIVRRDSEDNVLSLIKDSKGGLEHAHCKSHTLGSVLYFLVGVLG